MGLRLTSLAEADLAAFCALPGADAPTPSTVQAQGPDALVLWQDGGRTTARASLWWRRVPAYPEHRLGLIGHYAAADDAAAVPLLAAACAELARQGCTLAVGPMDGSTWHRYRLLTQRGAEPPFFLEPDNPETWPGHFLAAGFRELARYYSSINDDNSRCKPRDALRARLEKAGYRLRRVDMADLDAELGRLWRLAGEAFAANFLYVPIGEAEFRGIYAPLLARLRPELVCFVEWRQAPVAFALAVPDLLQAQRGEAVDTVIIKSVAVVPAHQGKGLTGIMLSHLNAVARGMGLTRTIHALMHETNRSRRMDAPWMRDFRRYALYARPLRDDAP